MLNRKIIIVGFAVFTMFFGAGNLVLPLLLVQKSQEYWFSSFLGFMCSAGLFTLIGLIASVVAGDIKTFFKPLGAFLGISIQILLMLIEGPFGVVPRGMIVSFGAVESVFPEVSKKIFYLITIIVIYYLARNRKKIVTILGKIITPIMIVFIMGLMIYVFTNTNTTMPELKMSFESYYDGLVLGYLTYDLPGAIYFTAVAIGYLKSFGSKKSEMVSNGIKSSIVTLVIMVAMYMSFIALGLVYSDTIAGVSAESILPSLIRDSLGGYAHYCFAAFIYCACITTSIAAISIWSEFVEMLFSKTKFKIHHIQVLRVSIVIAFFVAMNDFEGLMQLLKPILKVIYPILVGLSIYNIYLFKRSARIEE
jgi:branched-chain amino acid:cation transporter, LIVCS family